jgi:hypothetical protein
VSRATGPHATDREIDRLVYDLYNLTDEEIAIMVGTVLSRARCEKTDGDVSTDCCDFKLG